MDSIPVIARFIPGPGDGVLSAEDLAKINTTTSKPFKTEDLYGFDCIMATTELTSYSTRMGTSSLINMSADAEAGAPYHLMHNREPAPYGYTFRGVYDPTHNEARAGVYIPRGRMPAGKDGRTANQEIADIAAGLRREVSVQFYGPMMEWRCDLCGNDVFSWDCPHLPGMKFDGQLATCTVENARLLELSGVDRGACPGAVIGKARQMFAQSRFSAKEFAGWCDKAQVPDNLRTYSIPADSAGEGRQTMLLRAVLIGALTAHGLSALSASLGNIEDDPDKLAAALASGVKGHIETSLAADPMLHALKTAEITDPAKLQEALREADHGRKFMAKLRADAKSEGIRALGADSAADIEEMIEHMPIDLLEKQKTRWKADADKEFGTVDNKPAARQTAPGKLPEAPQAHAAAADGLEQKDWKERRKELMAHDPVGKKILAKEGAR